MSPPSQDTIMRHEAMHNGSPGSPAVRLRRACATAAGFLAISLLAAAWRLDRRGPPRRAGRIFTLNSHAIHKVT